ncbi:hypothetical protein KR215_000360, partial [Drosophila sulfurigaster]
IIMDNSMEQISVVQSPIDAQSQIFIFNSPAHCTDQQQQEQQLMTFPPFPGHIDGIQGYYVVYKHDHYIVSNPPDYKSPTKRSFLNECIRQLYVINGMAHHLNWLPTFPMTDRQRLWQQVDYCLRPERLTVEGRAMKHVKRQLFRESQRERKVLRSKVNRSVYWGTTSVSNYRNLRHHIGRHRVKRSYLTGVRRNVLQQLVRENVTQEMINTPSVCEGIIVAAERIFNVNPTVMQTLTERAKEIFAKEKARLAAEKTAYILEESVRSVIYAKQLFHLIQNPEELAYAEQQILETG